MDKQKSKENQKFVKLKALRKKYGIEQSHFGILLGISKLKMFFYVLKMEFLLNLTNQ